MPVILRLNGIGIDTGFLAVQDLVEELYQRYGHRYLGQ